MTSSIHIRDLGAGPPVLLLHGTPSPADDWLPVADRLAARYRVLVPDLPGYGRSPPPANAAIEAVGGSLAAALREAGVGRLRAIAGFSSGAYRAFELVLRNRVETDLVIGLGAFVTFDDEGRAMRRQIARSLETDPDHLYGSEMRELVRELMLSPSWRASHPGDLERVQAWVHLTSPAALVAELDALATLDDLRPELPTLAARAYLRVRELDLPCPPTVSDEIRRLVPGSVLEVVPGRGHTLLIEDLPGTIDALDRAIEGC